MPEKQLEDAAMKRLVALPQMVRSYLDHAPLPRELRGTLDFSTLRKLPTELISGNLMKRHADQLWEIDYHHCEDRLYVIIEIEFQSTPDPAMPLRMLAYAALIYESLFRETKPRPPSYRLPAVLPLVIYTGEAPWNVPQRVDELMGDNLKTLRPSFQYLLLDERQLVASKAALQEGPAADLMLIRHARDYGMMLQVYERIMNSEIYQSNQGLYAELVQEFGRRMFSTEVRTMDEMKARLAEMDRRSMARGFEQGIEQGVAQGIERGKLEGIESVALQMIAKGLSAREIQDFTGLTPEQIQELRHAS